MPVVFKVARKHGFGVDTLLSEGMAQLQLFQTLDAHHFRKEIVRFDLQYYKVLRNRLASMQTYVYGQALLNFGLQLVFDAILLKNFYFIFVDILGTQPTQIVVVDPLVATRHFAVIITC